MGKPVGKNKKKQIGDKSGVTGLKQSHSGEQHSRNLDADTAMFIDMSRELKEEGSKLFQRRDYRGAVLKYEKAVNLLPGAHADVASLRSHLAACFMQIEPVDYHRAIEQCNLALEVSPKHAKSLLKRARCYESLGQLEFAMRDADLVLRLEPGNAVALDIFERVKKGIEDKGIKLDDVFAVPVPEPVVVKQRRRSRKKNSQQAEDKAGIEGSDGLKVEMEKGVVKVERKGEVTLQNLKVKLVLGEDIRVAQIPSNCSILQLREIVRERFPSTKAVLVKYKDEEGDLVTITTTEELRWAEDSGGLQGSLRLYITEVHPEQDPLFLSLPEQNVSGFSSMCIDQNVYEKGSMKSEGEELTSCIEEWILQFAQLFKNHMGLNSDEYLDLHGLRVKLYSEAIEDVITSEDAQEILDMAAETFRELSALALFNWGNVRMSRARKLLFSSEDESKECVLEEVKHACNRARAEYIEAGKQYEQAVKIKPDFYEGFVALALQQFELAKLCWSYAARTETDLDDQTSSEFIELFNSAEDNMEKGTHIWEKLEQQRLEDSSKPSKENMLLQKMGLVCLKEISNDEATAQALNIFSQINLLWGTMLYERSMMEFKLKLHVWEDCLKASTEKFKAAGASPTDLAVLMKNHCAKNTSEEGLTFKIDKIVQALNEIYDAKKWACHVPSFRLEPLFRRRVLKLHHVLERVAV